MTSVTIPTPQIENIVDELLRRLKGAFPRIFLQRGFFADENTTWPAIYVVEDIEESKIDRTVRKGRYERTAIVGLSYFFKGPSDVNQTFGIANQEKQKVCFAVETDENFSGLCTHYGEVSCDKVFYKSGGVQIAITYEFRYVEPAPWWTLNPRRM